MDYGRFLRAVEAERMELLERRRSLYLDGKLEQLDADEWERIQAHDAWAGGGVEVDEADDD